MNKIAIFLAMILGIVGYGVSGVLAALAPIQIPFEFAIPNAQILQGHWTMYFLPARYLGDSSKDRFNSIERNFLNFKNVQAGNLGDVTTFLYGETSRLANEASTTDRMPSFYSRQCQIEQQACRIQIDGTENTPVTKEEYFLILDNSDSRDQVYFSGPVTIDWAAGKKMVFDDAASKTIHQLTVERFVPSDPHRLDIAFQERSPRSAQSLFSVINVVGALFAVAILVFIGMRYRKKDESVIENLENTDN